MEQQDSVANNFIVATFMGLESPIKNVWRHRINQKALLSSEIFSNFLKPLLQVSYLNKGKLVSFETTALH